MADILTQLQDAVDQLANQFVASLHYIHSNHKPQKLGPTDEVRKAKPDVEGDQGVDPDVFKDGQKELAHDLVYKEAEIEYLISSLPGIDNSEKDQEEMIRKLEEELKVAEEERKAAVKEKEAVLARLDNILRSIKRP